MKLYLPEGSKLHSKQNESIVSSNMALHSAKLSGEILEGIAVSCDASHNLIVQVGDMTGIIPREECAYGIASGQTRDIAILSRVGKPVCFVITDIVDNKLILSRRLAQERALNAMLTELHSGDVIPACVTHLEPFGAFVDIGCGIVSFIGIENISVSRINHPSERFYTGQNIYAAVLNTDYEKKRINLTHKELLGTWEQNAQLFSAGETVQGIVRSIEPYGVFIELAPNLSGLSEKRAGLCEGDAVSVHIKSILPERMKIKLNIIDVLPSSNKKHELSYFITDGNIKKWVYSPEYCENKYIATDFSATDIS